MWLNLPELQTTLEAHFTLHHSGLRRFGEVEPHQTHSNLPCRPASPFVTVIRGGSVYSNLPKITEGCPVLPSTVQGKFGTPMSPMAWH